jgi:hypothetical protein
MRSVVGAFGLCLALSACNDAAPAPGPAPTPTLTQLSLSFSGGGINSEGELPVGNSVQFTAFARLSDGSGQNVASAATWETANAMIATVSAGGLVEGVAPGTIAITATYQGLLASLPIVVVP